MAINPLVATRLPPAIMKQINADLETGLYRSVADWVRVACIEYAKQRQRDRAGGGGLTSHLRKKKLGVGSPHNAPF